MLRPGDVPRDGGSIAVLVIGYTTLAMVLVIVGVDVSKVFLARRALAAAADSAALAGSQGVDLDAVYGGAGLTCGERLPLAPARSARLVEAAVGEARPDLSHTFVAVGDPQTAVAGGVVGVRLTGVVAVPFGRVLGWLDPARSGGLVTVTATAHADSPICEPYAVPGSR